MKWFSDVAESNVSVVDPCPTPILKRPPLFGVAAATCPASDSADGNATPVASKDLTKVRRSIWPLLYLSSWMALYSNLLILFTSPCVLSLFLVNHAKCFD